MSDENARVALSEACKLDAVNSVIAAVNAGLVGNQEAQDANIMERSYAFTSMLAHHVTMLPEDSRQGARDLIVTLLDGHIKMQQLVAGPVAGHA